MSHEKQYTIADVKAKVNTLQQCVQNNAIEEIRSNFYQLQEICNFLNDQHKQKTCSDKSGDEVCGDDYTEFVMLLNIILNPIRQEPIISKINECLQNEK